MGERKISYEKKKGNRGGILISSSHFFLESERMERKNGGKDWRERMERKNGEEGREERKRREEEKRGREERKREDGEKIITSKLPTFDLKFGKYGQQLRSMITLLFSFLRKKLPLFFFLFFFLFLFSFSFLSLFFLFSSLSFRPLCIPVASPLHSSFTLLENILDLTLKEKKEKEKREREKEKRKEKKIPVSTIIESGAGFSGE